MIAHTTFLKLRDHSGRPLMLSSADVSSVADDGEDCVVTMRNGAVHWLPMTAHEFADEIIKQSSAAVAATIGATINLALPLLSTMGLMPQMNQEQ